MVSTMPTPDTCDNCGFRARQYYWRCPACGEWEMYSPRRTEEKSLPA